MSDNAPINFVTLGPGDYDRAKKIFDAAKHPGFIGREMFFRCATNGHAVVAVESDADLGVALIARGQQAGHGKLLALSVNPKARGRGIGSALVAHTRPEWVLAIQEKIPFFKRLGFIEIGAAKIGQSGKTATQLMQLQLGKMPESADISAEAPNVPRAEKRRAALWDSDDGALDAIARLRVARAVLDAALSAKAEADEAISHAQKEIAELESELFGKRAPKGKIHGGITFA